MNSLHIPAMLTAAYLAVFFQARFWGLRELIGAQVNLLPGLVVYAALSSGFRGFIPVAVVSGFLFDSVSQNPFGLTALTLLVVGSVVHYNRDLILREHPYAQFVVGTWANAACPVLGLLFLLGMGKAPLASWTSVPVWIFLSFAGGLLTPVWFWLFRHLEAALVYPEATESSFREDRELERGRS